MKIGVVNSVTLSQFMMGELQTISEIDILILAFGVTGDVNFENEIKGISTVYAELVLLSVNLHCVIVAAMDTDVYGLKHKSVLVIDNGNIIDITDMVHTLDTNYDQGAGFRVYDTSRGKIGIIVHYDALFPESARVLTVCDSDILITMIDADFPRDDIVMSRSAALANGIINICSQPDASYICDQKGTIISHSRKKLTQLEIEFKKNPYFLSKRRKDKYRTVFSNYLE